jgi:hypothetical protein
VRVPELVRREAASDARSRGGFPKLASRGGRRPRASAGRPAGDAEQRSNWHIDVDVKPGLELFPSPVVHPDLAAPAALAATHEHGATAGIEVGRAERERFMDAQPGAPKHDDQPT